MPHFAAVAYRASPLLNWFGAVSTASCMLTPAPANNASPNPPHPPARTPETHRGGPARPPRCGRPGASRTSRPNGARGVFLCSAGGCDGSAATASLPAPARFSRLRRAVYPERLPSRQPKGRPFGVLPSAVRRHAGDSPSRENRCKRNVGLGPDRRGRKNHFPTPPEFA